MFFSIGLKKIIRFNVSLTACLVLAFFIAGCSMLHEIDVPSSTEEIGVLSTDTTNERPYLTFDALRAFVDGKLSCKEICDTYAYVETGSGLYILVFPIEDVPSYSLILSFSHDIGNEPISVRLFEEQRGNDMELNQDALLEMIEYSDDNQQKETSVRFDMHIEIKENTVFAEPDGTMEAGTELIEKARKQTEEYQRVKTGLFVTELKIREENGKAEMIVSISNVSDNALKLYFDRGREFDFTVTNAKEEEVYRYSSGKEIAAQAISSYLLEKKDTLSFTKTWAYQDHTGKKVPSGKYLITAIMNPRVQGNKNLYPEELTDGIEIQVE